jgi:PPOX class probable F420-dependent enzyme
MKTLSEKAKKLIDQPNVACVATILRDGSPHVTPVWVDRQNDIVIINSPETTQKVKNLKRDPRIALCIYDLNNIHSRVVIRGKVTQITKNGAEDHIDKMEMKYNGEPRYPRHDAKNPRTIIRIQPTHIFEKIVG